MFETNIIKQAFFNTNRSNSQLFNGTKYILFLKEGFSPFQKQQSAKQPLVISEVLKRKEINTGHHFTAKELFGKHNCFIRTLSFLTCMELGHFLHHRHRHVHDKHIVHQHWCLLYCSNTGEQKWDMQVKLLNSFPISILCKSKVAHSRCGLLRVKNTQTLEH